MRFPLGQWMALLSVIVATAGTIAIWEGGRWPLGLFVPPHLAARELALGSVWGTSIIGACTVLVMLFSNLREGRGDGFPWLELATTFVPAALHEELLFRGYAFQRLYRWKRPFAILFVAAIFAALHARNAAATPLGLANVFLGGVLLGLAYARFERLWFPIGLHLAWNLTIGPVLGHEVSGYHSSHTLFVERGSGPDWVTGGAFGLEGSLWMTAVELVAIALMNIRKAPSVAGAGSKGANQ